MQTKQMGKLLMAVLPLVMIPILVAGLTIAARAEDTAIPCEVENCGGTYKNGFCSVCDGYQAASQDDDGYYLIGNAGQLYWFAQLANSLPFDQYVNGKLTADIVVNPGIFDENGSYTPGGGESGNAQPRVWTPIGQSESSYYYRGVFDGAGHSISGLYYNNTTTDRVGLFGFIQKTNSLSCVVKNVSVVNTYFAGNDYVGGVVGTVSNSGVVTGCSYSGTVCGNQCVGGIAGSNGAGEISDCYNSGRVEGYWKTGGVVGNLEGGSSTKVTNCYNIGTVIGVKKNGKASQYTGGIAGYKASKIQVTNSYYLVGCATDSEGTVQNGIGAATAGSTTADEAGKTVAMTENQFRSGEVACLLGGVWGQDLSGSGYPTQNGAAGHVFIGQSLNIGTSLSMKYYVAAFGSDFDLSKLKVEFTFLEEVTEVTGVKDTNTGLYVFTFYGITPQCMGENIKAVLKYDSVVKDTKATYSVEENLTNLLEDTSLAETTRTLIGDILAYGKAAENVTGYSSLEGAYEVRDVAIEGDEIELEEPFVAYTVHLGYVNYIKLKLKNVDSVYIDGKETETIFEYNGGYCYGYSQTGGIAPADFGTRVVFNANNRYELKFSINDYLYVLYNSENATDGEKTLAQALYNYGLSASAYRSEHTGS